MIIPMTIDHAPPAVSFRMDLDHNNPVDAAMYWYLAQNTYPELEVVNAAKRILRPGDRVIDGGACVGYHTLIFSRLVGLEGRVIAVEPGFLNAEKFDRNLKLNDASNVKIVDAAIASDRGVRQMHLSQDGGLHSFWRGKDHSDEAEVVTVRLDELGVQPRLVKLDVEGAELEALRGAGSMVQGWTSTTIPFIICETNAPALEAAGTSVAELRSFMYDRGYDLWILSLDFMPVLIPPKTVFKPTRVNTNVLFATQEAVGEAWTEVSA